MYITFENIPADSKVFIYQSNREFTNIESLNVETELKSFLESWTSHGESLTYSFLIKYNRFLIVAVDQEVQNVSGCAIDDLVRFIQSLEEKYSVDLLDKMNVTYKTDKNIIYVPLLDFKKLVKAKTVVQDTIVFNNLVNTVGEFNEKWEIRAVESWHSRFF